MLQAIYDQKEELEKYSLHDEWVVRVPEADINANSRLAQVVMGVRRSGKSTLAHRALQDYTYGYLNFDDEVLSKISAEHLPTLLQYVYQAYGDVKYLMLDEVQNVEGWHLFVNKLLRNGLHVVLTGSNSKLLSKELATHLTGRYAKVELFPFSFKEYIAFKKVVADSKTTKGKGLLLKAFDDYKTLGGFPDIIKGEDAKTYVSALFDSIIMRDIFYRHSIKYSKTFKDVALYLIDNFGREVSYNRIKKIFALGSENTAKNYTSYLEEAYLVLTLQKFSFKKQESLRYRKVYLVDTVFASVLSNSFSANSGFVLENMVYLELLRHRNSNQTEIYYYKQQHEVDFVVVKNRKVVELIQVCKNISYPKTLNREVRALLEASEVLKCKKLTIIAEVGRNSITVENKTISLLPITEWLLL